MEKRIINREFFERKAEAVAQDLLGKFICRKFDDGSVLRWCITETEAYDDYENFTYNNKMFCGIGEWCPYNGMIMINCSTEKGNDNVLIRALDCVKGPCNIVDVLKIKEIKCEVTNQDVICHEKLWLEDRGVIVAKASQKKRVGLVKNKVNQDDVDAVKNYKAQAICFPFFD